MFSRDDQPQSRFRQSAKGGLFLSGKALRPQEQVV
jgi:hypothetical protein